MQEQWREIGVQATPKTEEWNALLNRFNKTRDYELILIGFSWGVDPDQTTMWHSKSTQGGFNNNSYSNPEVDKLLEQGIRETNREKRKAIYRQLDKLLLDDMGSPILVFQKTLMAVNKRLKGVEPNAFNLLHNIESWTVS
jgi:peptide/nickel transport system substrate-binding protein